MTISKQLGEPMKKRTRSTFSPEFRLEASQLVVDQNYTICETAKAINVGISTMIKWVAQHSQEKPNQVADQLNNRPRKTLMFETPKQVFTKECCIDRLNLQRLS